MVFIALLLCFSNFETCNARRGKHWRHSRSSTSASLYSKKKGKSHGSNHHHATVPKPKTPSPPKKSKNPPPSASPPPKKDFPAPPPEKGYNNGHSAIFDVLDFGAKGDGNTDDTKVNYESTEGHKPLSSLP